MRTCALNGYRMVHVNTFGRFCAIERRRKRRHRLKHVLLALVLLAQPVLLYGTASAGPGGGYPLRNATNLIVLFCDRPVDDVPVASKNDPLALAKYTSPTWQRSHAFCMGYVEAIADIARPTLCLPSEVQTPELVGVFEQWANNNADSIIGSGVPAAEAIVTALGERWPCPAPRFD